MGYADGPRAGTDTDVLPNGIRQQDSEMLVTLVDLVTVDHSREYSCGQTRAEGQHPGNRIIVGVGPGCSIDRGVLDGDILFGRLVDGHGER